MGQGDILETLDKLNKPCSRGEIAKIMGLDPVKISHWLATLIKHHEVMIKEISRQEAAKYNCKRKIRLYYTKTWEENNNGRTKTTTRRTEISTY